MPLEKLRKRINKIDERILRLLNQRTQNVLRILRLKKKEDLPAFSPEREKFILERIKLLNKGPLSNEDIELIFREILSVSRYLQDSLKVVYLGPQGTFTHQVAIKCFGKKCHYIDADTIKDVFFKVEQGEAEYGVVPIENSIEGIVNYTLDMFLESDLKICSEKIMNIHHCLLAPYNVDTKNIKIIYSNPQVFAQCRTWLNKHFPKVELINATSTAMAAQIVKKDKKSACIGGSILADIYNLNILYRNIEDYHHNITRFLVISKKDSLPSGKDKTSILFSIKDKVGALYEVLKFFKDNNINLSKIESRPSKQRAWDYYFFVDFDGHREDAVVKKTLQDLEKVCIFVKILGSYPKEG